MEFLKLFSNTALRKRTSVRGHDGLDGTHYVVEGDGQIELIPNSPQEKSEPIKIHFRTSPYRSLTLWRSPSSAFKELQEVSVRWWHRVYRIAGTSHARKPTKVEAPALVLPVSKDIRADKVRTTLRLPDHAIAIATKPVVLPHSTAIKLGIPPLPQPQKAVAVRAPDLDLRRPSDLYQSTNFQR